MFKISISNIIDLFFEKGFERFLHDYNTYIEEQYDGKRGPMNFIDQFLEYTKDAESHTSFLRWSAIATIAATLRDNVYLSKGAGVKIYPNLYVILVADSGSRKGFPLSVSKKLLNKISNTKIIAGRTSIQSVLTALATNTTQNVVGVNGHMLAGASGILYSEELASLLVDDKATIPILTDLYDNHEEWENSLKTMDKEKLKNVCITLLAASNETFLKEVYQGNAIYGGLLARTVLVAERGKRKVSSRLNAEEVSADHLVAGLRRISGYKGKITYESCGTWIEEDSKFTVGCGKCASCTYGSWYHDIQKITVGRAGVEARIHTTAEKIAICLAAADEGFKNEIKDRHIKEAIDLCVGILQNYKFFTISAATGKNVNPAALILSDLIRADGYTLSKLKILRSHLGEIDGKTIDEVMDRVLIPAKYVDYVPSVGKDGIGYRLTEKYLEAHREMTK